MEKKRLIKQIIASLSESLVVLEKAARASHAEATHESSKAESKYDTRVAGRAKQEFFVVSKPGKLPWYRVLGEEHPPAQSLRRPERSEGRRKDWAGGCGG
jgi:hypothetical protein